jgi:hypothetical protein
MAFTYKLVLEDGKTRRPVAVAVPDWNPEGVLVIAAT